MSNLTFVGRPDNVTAYGRLSIALLRGMVKAGLDVDVRLTQRQPNLPDDIQALCKSGIRYGKAWELIYHPPNILPTPNHSTIYKTTFESTRLSPMSVKCLNAARAVIVPSQWNATIASANGVNVPIFVVPDGIDTDVFHYQPAPQRRAFAFACAGRTAHGAQRKGLNSVIRLFQQAFPDNPDVRLWVKTMPGDPLPPINDSRVQVQAKFLTDEQLATWLAACHCFVSLATGAFELLPLEAMAVGRPVISHSYGGVAEYFSEHVGYQVSHGFVPAQDQWRGLGVVAQADDESVIAAMRHVFANRMECVERGVKAAAHASRFTMGNMCAHTLAVVQHVMKVALPKKTEPKTEPDTVTIFQLGRYGDIINVLPLAHSLKADGFEPEMVVARQYADVLDGVSYCKARIFDGEFEDIGKAIGQLDSKFSIVSQIYGRGLAFQKTCGAFNVESWRQAGHLDRIGKWPLVFDQRNEAREHIRSVGMNANTVLFFGDGTSSPFPEKAALLEQLRIRLPNLEVIDMTTKMERIYDLLGFIERAVAVVTIDTAVLHLCEASATPVVAMIADTPSLWHGTEPRANVVFKVRYSEALKRASDMASVIAALPTGSRLIHVNHFYIPGDKAAQRRSLLAYQTYRRQYRLDRWVFNPVGAQQLPRMFDDTDGRKLPYIKDLFNHGVFVADADDIIVMTNSDTCMAPNLSPELRRLLENCDAVCSHRYDFSELAAEKTAQQLAKEGTPYLGTDIFALKKSWWEKHRDEMPDMIHGAEAWDWCLRELVKAHGGASVTGLVYHERHDTAWETGRNTLASQRHNCALAKPFLERRGLYSGEFQNVIGL